MKLKITSSTLVFIILIQVVLLEVIIISFLVKTIIKHNNIISAAKVNEIVATLPKNKNQSSSTSNNMEIYKQTALSLKTVREEVFKEMFNDMIFKKQNSLRVFKLSLINVEKEEPFIATTYDLSYESCGKYPSDPAYGITFSGKKAQRGRTIAVDPQIIPLGSKVYIDFPSQYASLNGWYIAEDTGNKVKGNIVDVFLGTSAFQEMEKFGSRQVSVKVETSNQKF